MQDTEIDWTDCADVERIPGKVSGQWIVVGTRILAQGVIDNADDYSPDEIATEIFPGLGVERARRIVEYARTHAKGLNVWPHRLRVTRILLDQNVPFPLTRHLLGHDVVHASTAGWEDLANGLLIAAAEEGGFELLITADQNLEYQQNLTARHLSLVVLSTNNWNTIRSGLPSVIAAVDAVAAGGYRFVQFDLPALRRRLFNPRPDCWPPLPRIAAAQ
jgi:hypothetical protein